MGTNDDEHRSYILNREAEVWRTRWERAQDRLDELDPDCPEAKQEEAWQNHCLSRLNEVGSSFTRFHSVSRPATEGARWWCWPGAGAARVSRKLRRRGGPLPRNRKRV
jgi:hypothetical protein